MAKLPKFIDKIIYTNEQSYSISSSFKGILRLSPNDKKTFQQRVGIQLSVVEKDTGAANYADNIDFDGDEPKTSFTACDLDDTMILCTDSYGYVVGFRLSAKNPEFDNLGVIGVTKTKTLQLYTRKNDSFTINGQMMPSKAYEPTEEDESSGKYFLSMNKTDNKWDYYSPDDFIKKTIVEILRSFETIPTGSIHWCPVTIEQYKTLCEKNSYGHNKTESDPLVRDFLVCDGRKYRCSDFPELAKFLNGEKVTCHIKKEYEYDDNGEKIKQTFYYPDQREETISEDDVDKRIKYFNVPDLRHMYISSVIAKGIHGSSENASPTAILSPDSGAYTPDCNADGITIAKNQHRHFTTYGTWQVRGYSDYFDYYSDKTTYPDVYPNTKIRYDDGNFSTDLDGYEPTVPVINPDDYYDKTTKTFNKIKSFKNDKIVGIMPLHNHPYAYYTTGMGTKSGGMIGFGQRIGENNRRNHTGANSVSAVYFLSRPNYSKPNFNVKYVGRSSYDIDCFENPYDDSSTTTTTSSTDYESLSAGHENIGTFYAMLPLIKI